tara:strand:- start:8414 stop:8752 length:339 start_codon:yes stop_codon:yes gene_type:complete
MRWVQRLNEETGKHEFIPRDKAAVKRDSTSAIHGDIVSFVSPVDGSVISDRKQLREHNKRNNVVNSSEFDQGFLDRKRKERDRLYTGEHTTAEKFERKQEIYNNIMRLEREG